LRALAGLLGLLTRDPQVFLQATPRNEGEISAADIEALIGQRVAAKQRKDYAAADRIRSELATAGVILEDGAKGTGWRRARNLAGKRLAKNAAAASDDRQVDKSRAEPVVRRVADAITAEVVVVHAFQTADQFFPGGILACFA
jgi:hypothetical protein